MRSLAGRRALVAAAALAAVLVVVAIPVSGVADLSQLANSAGSAFGPRAGVKGVQLVRFAEELVFAWQWGEFGGAAGQFNFPVDVAVDHRGNVYVADNQNKRVQKFTSAGQFLSEFRLSEGKPVAVATDSDGNVFVSLETTSSATRKIEKFDAHGQKVRAWLGTAGPALVKPVGLTTDRDGNLYVADAGDGTVKRYDRKGRFVLQWAPQDATGMPPRRVSADRSGSSIYVVSSVSGGVGEGTHRVQRYEGGGGWLSSWDLRSYRVEAIAVDPDGRGVYLADFWASRVLLHTKDGREIAQFRGEQIEAGHGGGYTTGVAVDGNGDVYVTSLHGQRVSKFRFGLPDIALGVPDFAVSATSSSGLPITFTAEGACTIKSGNMVHINSRGRCTVTAVAPGDPRYAPARKARSFDVH